MRVAQLSRFKLCAQCACPRLLRLFAPLRFVGTRPSRYGRTTGGKRTFPSVPLFLEGLAFGVLALPQMYKDFDSFGRYKLTVLALQVLLVIIEWCEVLTPNGPVQGGLLEFFSLTEPAKEYNTLDFPDVRRLLDGTSRLSRFLSSASKLGFFLRSLVFSTPQTILR